VVDIDAQSHGISQRLPLLRGRTRVTVECSRGSGVCKGFLLAGWGRKR
jgi:hypothetical protein